jgi:putative ABC transport system ATP-binding protein
VARRAADFPPAGLPEGPDREGPAHALELRGVSRTYREGEGERIVLRGVDLVIGRGEFAVLVGRSGSGKSTLLNLVSGIDAPTAGEVLIEGTAITRLGERERTLFRRRHIGFIFQFFNLVPTLTVAENLQLPLALLGRDAMAARARVQELLGQVELTDRASSFPDRLSGGEQQRVAVARALAHDPRLVLADEPTGNLDTESAERVLSLLSSLSRARGTTVIVVTHSTDVARLADRVLTLKDGGVIG